MATGLVLEGGAMRGLFTAGILDVMLEAGCRFDGIIGVSAGAAFGCNYKSKQLGRVLRYNLQFCRDKRYCGVSSLLRTGNLYNSAFCYGEIPFFHDPFDFETYQKSPVPFYVVCTDVETGEAIYPLFSGRPEEGFDLLRASASMPLVSEIVSWNGYKLLDGGIADPIPLVASERLGYAKNVVILTRPADYQKKKSGLLPILQQRYKPYPQLLERMRHRHELYNQSLTELAEKEARGGILVFRPEEALPVHRVEKHPKQLQLAYNIGRNQAKKRLPELLAFLASEGE